MKSKLLKKAAMKYPDSAQGAIAYLADDSQLNVKGASARPDPSVKGVWMVTTKQGEKAIVYLAGYPDPFGKLRPENDFEVADDPSIRLPDLPISEGDDKCEACLKETANRECAHGILCDTCDEQIHGAVGATCDLDT